MTLHDCSRIGCTRLTAEQECDLHAAERAGVVGYGPLGAHWQRGCPCPQCATPKEPRLAPTLLTALAEALARADKAEAERDAAKALLPQAEGYKQRLRMEIIGSLTDAGIYMLVSPHDPTGPGEVPSAIRRLASQRDEWKRRAEEFERAATYLAEPRP